MTVLDRVKGVHWRLYDQPEWNDPLSVPKAIEKLLNSEEDAYICLINAVGNNHAGTYYPIVLELLPFLEEIIKANEPSPQRIAICFLDDLFASFHPQSGYEKLRDGTAQHQDLEVTFRSRVRQLMPILMPISSSTGPNAALASEFLSLIREAE